MKGHNLLVPRVAVLALLLSVAIQGTRNSSLAQSGSRRAAIVLRLDSGQVIVRVASFSSARTTGLELAQSSGSPIVAWNNLVCKIGAQGCDNPSSYDGCFCQCTSQSGKCEFWRYFHWRNGAWQFSGTGAGEYTVPADGIDGWIWGGNDERPPEIEPAAVWNDLRLAPGLAQATSVAGTLGVEIDLQGDANHNSSAIARYRPSGGTWGEETIPLSRLDRAYSGAWPTPLRPGDYELSVAFADADGINGSTTITQTVRVAEWQAPRLPMLLRD